MQTFNINKMLAITISATLLLAGCGGGSNETQPATTLIGTASKGIIIEGVVTAFKIENGLIDDTPIATGTTDSAGKYSLIIENYSGPLHIVVSAASNSKMKCDAISGCDTTGNGVANEAFGATIAMPSDLKMEAVVPSVNGGTAEGNINPLTHMAAAFAKSKGLGKLGIEAANDRVEALFNVESLLGGKVIDITGEASVQSAGAADANALKIAYLSSAIAEIAIKKKGGDISAAVNALASSYVNNNGQLVENYNGLANEDGSIALVEIIQAAIDTLVSGKTIENMTLDAGINSEINAQNTAADSATPGNTTNTEVEITNSDLETARGIVQTVSTWSTQLTALRDKGELFAEEVEMAESANKMAFETVGTGLVYASAAAAEAFDLTQRRSNQLYQALAGKTLSFEAGDSVTFGCQDDFQMGATEFQMDGEGFPMGNGGSGAFFVSGLTAYLDVSMPAGYQQNDSRATNFTFPSNQLVAGLDFSSRDLQFGGEIVSSSLTISSIAVNETCDLSVSTDLSAYIDHDYDAEGTGTVEVSGNSVTVKGSVIEDGLTSQIDMTYTLPNYEGSTFNATLRGTVETADKATLTIANTSAASVIFPSSFVLLDEVNEMPLPSSATFRLDATLAQGSQDDQGAAIDDPMTFQGVLDFSLVRTSAPATGDIDDLSEKNINPASLSLKGKFSNTSGESFAADLTATMTNANSFVWEDVEGSLRNDLGSYVFSNANNTLTVTFPDGVYTYTFEDGSITVTTKEQDDDNQYSYSAGTYSSLNQFLTQYWWFDWQSVYVDFEGEYSVEVPAPFNLNGGNLVGKLENQELGGETKNNWRDLDATLTMDAVFEGLQPAKLTVNADRTGYAAGDVSATFSYENITLTLAFTGDAMTEEFDTSLVVTDNSGASPARLTIYTDFETDEVNGSVVVNGAVIGSITSGELEGQLLVNYIDGSFSSVIF